MARRPGWITAVEKRWKAPLTHAPGPRRERALAEGIYILVAAGIAGRKSRYDRFTLPGQPFDSELLAASPLYRASRRAYLDLGGEFEAGLVSAGRTLSSAILLEPLIEYSPIEDELVWRATDPLEAKRVGRLDELRRFIGSVFHEQNHRILWEFLPPVANDAAAARRYLNFAEALVIATDMALSDELGPRVARLFHWAGVLYDPGTEARAQMPARLYRNYLHACVHATYLHLEGFRPVDVARVITTFHSNIVSTEHGRVAERALVRAGNLNAKFLGQTNLAWQRRHMKAALKKLTDPRRPALELPADPNEYYQPYMLAERWFERLGL